MPSDAEAIEAMIDHHPPSLTDLQSGRRPSPRPSIAPDYLCEWDAARSDLVDYLRAEIAGS